MYDIYICLYDVQYIRYKYILHRYTTNDIMKYVRQDIYTECVA